MKKYFDTDMIPKGTVRLQLQRRSLPAYKLIFKDGYDEILIQFPGDPPVGFSKRFKELVANHGHPVDFRSLKIIDNDEIRKELNSRFGRDIYDKADKIQNQQ